MGDSKQLKNKLILERRSLAGHCCTSEAAEWRLMHFLSWLCPEDALPQLCKQLIEKQILPANNFCPSHPRDLRISAGKLGRSCSVLPIAPGLQGC